jgi:transcriptional regulator with XRE-family HTH domain/tetratricopeptide (TPR) repeat protein
MEGDLLTGTGSSHKVVGGPGFGVVHGGEFDGRALRQARVARGWSRADVVAKLLDLEGSLATQNHIGADSNLVGKWESGRRRPNVFYAARLCLVFGLPAERLGLMHLGGKPRFDLALAQFGRSLESSRGAPALANAGSQANAPGVRNGTNASPDALAGFISQLTRQMADDPRRVLLPFAAEYLRLVQSKTGSLSESNRRRLRALLGEASCLLDGGVNVSHDDRSTSRYWYLAEGAAEDTSASKLQKKDFRTWLKSLGMTIASWESSRGLISNEDFLCRGREYFQAIDTMLGRAERPDHEERHAVSLASRLAVILGNASMEVLAIDRAQEWWHVAASLASNSNDRILQAYCLIEQSGLYMPVWGPLRDIDLASSFLRAAKAVAPKDNICLRATLTIRSVMFEAGLFQEATDQRSRRRLFSRVLNGVQQAEQLIQNSRISAQDPPTDLFGLLQPGVLSSWKGSALLLLELYDEAAALLQSTLSLIPRQPPRFHACKDLGHALIAGKRDGSKGVDYLQQALEHCLTAGDRRGALAISRRVTESMNTLRGNSSAINWEPELKELREKSWELVRFGLTQTSSHGSQSLKAHRGTQSPLP